MKIDVEDYLSHEEIKDICEEQVRESVSKQLRREQDFERIFSNAAYHIMFQLIDDAFDEDIKEVLKKKTLEILNTKTEFGIFRKRDAWEKDESFAYAYVQTVVTDNMHLIHDKIISEIQRIPKKDLSPLIKQSILEKFK
jgi:hypothetical protein